jgi:3-oxoacyl-[acyl-carrier-protein] synthase II
VNLLERPVVITSEASRCALGADSSTAVKQLRQNRSGLRPARDFPGFSGLAESPPGGLAGWIGDRSPLRGRKYGAASNLAIHVAREAVAGARWSPVETENAWLFAGSSRGNTCELLGEHHHRRPIAKYAASNSMHGEIAAAVSIECGIRGPWNMLSNGCASGLDALIWAAHAVASGIAPRALVVAVELPLLPCLLRDFASTGLLGGDTTNDPYSPSTNGFHPGEAGVAICLEPGGKGTAITGAWMNADAYDPVGLPADGSGIAPILAEAWEEAVNHRIGHGEPVICPHASGTFAHGMAEQTALRGLAKRAGTTLQAHLLKPYTGHTLGASGALDVALMHACLFDQILPPNLPPAGTAGSGIILPTTISPAGGRTVVKISVGMGGHNAIVNLRPANP